MSEYSSNTVYFSRNHFYHQRSKLEDGSPATLEGLVAIFRAPGTKDYLWVEWHEDKDVLGWFFVPK
jgi:hypothetical protein